MSAQYCIMWLRTLKVSSEAICAQSEARLLRYEAIHGPS